MKTNSRFLSVIPLYRMGMILLFVSAFMLSCQKDEPALTR
jgi:hypothetical protein